MILNPLGVHLTQLLPFVRTMALFYIAWAICNRFLFCRSQTRQTLTTFIPYIPSTKKHYILLTWHINDKNTFKQIKFTHYLSI